MAQLVAACILVPPGNWHHHMVALLHKDFARAACRDFVQVIHREPVAPHPHKDSVEEAYEEPAVLRMDFLAIRRTRAGVEMRPAAGFQKKCLVPGWDP